MSHRLSASLLLGLGLALFAAAGCTKKAPPEPASAPKSHTHVAPQGGVLAELGEEAYHIEFRHGETPGVVQAFIMDGEAENFVRSDQLSFAARGRSGEQEVSLAFQAVASSATGEKAGDTSLFEATTGLSGSPVITITVPFFTLKGQIYRDVTAQLPAGKP